MLTVVSTTTEAVCADRGSPSGATISTGCASVRSCLLILYHIGMYYVTWDWHVKSPHASAAIEPLMLLTSPWRLSLLFLVSGVATGYLLERQGVRGFLGRRSVRLLVPLVFGMLVIVPPQSYLEVVEKVQYAGSYGEFLASISRLIKGFAATGIA